MPEEKDTPAHAIAIGRYVLFREVAHGGMATVHLGRLRGPAGFARTVAIKRLHPQYARDPEFVQMFLDEARLAARIQHPNVVSVLDVVSAEGELFLVMDYVHGESLAKLLHLARTEGTGLDARIAAAIASNVLFGLHAAHEARSEKGEPLGIVHRDVSPQNVLVGTDGVARVLDFGIAKARDRSHSTTRDGQVKGKVPYMAPEQLERGQIDRRTDVYAAAVMIWEALTGQRLFPKAEVVQLVQLIMKSEHRPPSSVAPNAPKELDQVVLKGLARDPEERWATAHDMAVALERAWPHASGREVGEWVQGLATESLEERARSIGEIESAALPAGTRSMPPREVLVGMTALRGSTDSQSPPPITPDERPAGVPSSRRRLWIAGGGAVAAAGLVGWFLVGAQASKPRPAAGPTAGAFPAAVAPPSAIPLPPPSVSASSASSDDSAHLAPSHAPDASSTAAPGHTPLTPVTTAPGHHRPSGRPGGNCDPPYTIDANGVRIPKRQCL